MCYTFQNKQNIIKKEFGQYYETKLAKEAIIKIN